MRSKRKEHEFDPGKRKKSLTCGTLERLWESLLLEENRERVATVVGLLNLTDLGSVINEVVVDNLWSCK